jgi:Pvc16 N-terminal domain
MMRQALELIRNRLNAFLGSADPRPEGWVVLGNLVDHEGKPFPGAENKLVMFLGNVEYEASMSLPGRTAQLNGDTYVSVAAPRLINVWLLFVANFYNQSYPDGLDILSRTIAFFQQHPRFTHDSDPALDPRIEKLTVEMVNLDFMQLNYVMSMTGAKYLPMVCYKMRMIPFTSEAIQATVPAARALGGSE